ncbi:MAG TPA: Ppx/GppA phosphatase family protein [Caulobacteraceae bacterium]|nr:Ppx/GppA phosphatase family protein [Caulobacteraceae bacterium]
MERPRCYAALDLGTNNCRLLIATPTRGGFRVVEAFSRIVRLGEGLTHTGRLQDAAIERAMAALAICAEKVRRRQVVSLRAVATQACRSAENGQAFIDRVEAETGLKLSIIEPEEEARLAVAGCANLLDRTAEAALVIDVGGGSTELSWVAFSGENNDRRPRLISWLSVPIGVVSLAERFPEPEIPTEEWWESMVGAIRSEIAAFGAADPLRSHFLAGRAHLIGTSGAITSLAGLHLGLQRYDRSKVDGLWMTRDDCRAAADRLRLVGRHGRAQEPCIGPDRADLVLAGAAILEAVQQLWPCERVRVADRGLREGMLLALMREGEVRPKRRRRRRRRGGAGVAASMA